MILHCIYYCVSYLNSAMYIVRPPVGSMTFNSMLYELKVCTKNTFFFPVGDRAWGFGGHNWSTLEQVILVSAQS